MAKKKTSSAADSQVTRVRATTTSAKKEKAPVAAKKTAPAKVAKKQRYNPILAFFGYFKGAWQELKQVRWPTRKATWGLTLAVLLFSVFFIVVVLLLDGLFEYVFNLILGQ